MSTTSTPRTRIHTATVHAAAAGAESDPGTLRRQLAFMREFVKAPHVVAAIAPSSPRLAKKMIDGLDLRGAGVVVEFGPGTGTFTKAVLEALPADWLGRVPTSNGASAGPASALPNGAGDPGGARRFIAIEFNKALADILRKRYPQVAIHNDDAANVVKILEREGLGAGRADAIISGLGWPSFSDEVRTRILEATHAALKPGGEFRTFGYHVGLLMRGAWHFRSEVRRLFKHVEISRVVWRNAPPAFVYRCVK